MPKITIGNTTKNVSNTIATRAGLCSVEPDYWYAELFDTFPTYKCKIDINRSDDVDDGDIYYKIFKELSESENQEFKILMCEYGYDELDKMDPYAEKFVLVSNNEPIIIYYSYGILYVMTHIGIDRINEIVNKYFLKYEQKNNDVKCYVIMNEDGSMYLEDFNVDIPNENLDFDMYNEGFDEIHNNIKESIINDKNGLYLLYGTPGTGKTSYIRHLIKECGTEERKFVYVPVNLFSQFASPNILPFLFRHKGCVFIIEDCESLVTSESGMRSEEIANLLNMTDGLLGDALSVKIICTFNVDDGKIDNALLRPGRCKGRYEFKLLDKNRANKLADKFNLKKVNKDVSLGEIFNEGKSFTDKKKKIGFR